MDEQERQKTIDEIIQGFKYGYRLSVEQIDFIAKYGTEKQRNVIYRLQKAQMELLKKKIQMN